jgi:F-type H+-transporting ATPase subunit b
MKRLVLLAWLALFVTFSFPLSAQETESGNEEPQPPIEYKWINFGILVIGLGYLIVSKGMPALNERGLDIQRALKAAEQIKADAAKEAAEIDRKMAGLKSEIDSIRAAAKAEMDAERVRMTAETESLVAKLKQNAESEVAVLTKQASNALRAQASSLALQLAYQKVGARMTNDVEASLVAGFVGDLQQIGQEARN